MKRPWRDPKPKRRNETHRRLIEDGPRGGAHHNRKYEAHQGMGRKAKHKQQAEDEWWDEVLDEECNEE